jgi:nicotinate-nucleotide adenylyltransferase
MKIAVFGGAFNPIHYGHLRLAREFASRLKLDKVMLIPSSTPPHKLHAHMAADRDRLEMCRLSVKGDPLFLVSDIEIKRAGVSFTADTLDKLTELYPTAQWYLITGADMFLTLGTWHRFEDIMLRAILCTAPRDDIEGAKLREYAAVLEKRGAKCIIEDIPKTDISSTKIRQLIRSGKDIDCLVPNSVKDYIYKNSLYKNAIDSTENSDAQFIEIIRGRLTPYRFRHSLAVAEQAKHLALLYGADPKKAYAAGILHDIMKDEPKAALLQMLSDFGIILNNAQMASPSCWHAIAGAEFVRNILKIGDDDIINAVRYHTTARAGMSPLEKTIFVADFTSLDRDYPDIDEMRRRAQLGSGPAMEYALSYTIRELLNKSAVILPDAIDAYNEIIALKQKESNNYAATKSSQK